VDHVKIVAGASLSSEFSYMRSHRWR